MLLDEQLPYLDRGFVTIIQAAVDGRHAPTDPSLVVNVGIVGQSQRTQYFQDAFINVQNVLDLDAGDFHTLQYGGERAQILWDLVAKIWQLDGVGP